MKYSDTYNKDVKVLRELAKRVAEIAYDDEQNRRRKLWRDVNSFRNTGVPIYVRWGGWWDEIINPELECEDDFYRGHEFALRTMLWQSTVGDDYVIEPWITQKATYIFPNNEPWGIKSVIERSRVTGGAFHIDPPIKDLEDIKKLVMPTHSIDELATKSNVEKIRDALGDILTVNIDRAPFYRFFEGDISSQMAYLRGIDRIMYDIYDNSEWFSQLLSFVAEGIEKTHREAEQAGDWQLSNQENQAMPYVDELRDPVANSGGIKRSELWGYMASQEYTLISPEHFYEYLLKYQIPILQKFGLVAYACCEDITHKIEYIKKIPNLRRIGITAFSDCERCAEQIGSEYVSSWRPKPSETVCIDFDEQNVRKILSNGIKALRRNNCIFDITLKDVHTIKGDINRLIRFVQIAKEEASV